VTADRELALASSRTGGVTRVVTTFDTMPLAVDLAPDGRTALVTLPPAVESNDPPASVEECASVVEVDVVSGAQRRLTAGGFPRYSPDGRSIVVGACPGNAVRILRTGAPPQTFPGSEADDFVGPVFWAADGTVYVQQVGDDSNWLVRLDPATDRSVDDAEPVVVTYFTTMRVPVPWRDTLLHTSSSEIDDPDVFAARSYRDGYVDEQDLLFRMPHPVEELVVGPDDVVLVRAGKALWRWDGSGDPVRIGAAYPVYGW